MVLPVAYGGSGTGFGFIIPESASALIPFANNTARDTWASANLVDLLANQTIVSVTGTPDVWYIWRGQSNPATYNAANWETFTNVVQGNPGPTGPAGPAGPTGDAAARNMFDSNAARNTFYGVQTNRDNLNNGDIITVNVGNNTVEFQQWLGVNAPTTYNSNNFVPVSLRTSSSSIEFAQNLRIFDFGQIPGFEDMGNDVLALAIGQRFTTASGSQVARQLSFTGETPLITANAANPPVNSASQAIHTYTINTTGLITNQAVILQGTINFVVAPNFYIIEIFRGVDDTGPLVFKERFDPNGTAGIFTARADGLDGRPSPQRFLPNTTYFFRLTGDIDFQYVQADGVTNPAGTSTGFEIKFENLATQDWVNQNAAIIIQDEAVDLSTKATILNFAGDGVVASGSGVSKTITIPGGISGIIIEDEGVSLTDLTTTVNFTGSGVTASGIGASKTVNIPGGISGLNIQEEGVNLSTAATTLNFVGDAVTAAGETAIKTITFTGISGLNIEEDGAPLATSATTLNFVGTGVTAAGTGTTKTVTIPAGITVEDEGVALTQLGTTLNFTGAGVTVSGSGSEKTVIIPGAGVVIPSLHNFSINIDSRVDLNTDLNNQRIVTFDVSNYSQLTGLNLVVTIGTNQTLTLPISDGVQTQNVTLAGIDTSTTSTLTFQLSGTYSAGTVTSNIVTINIANSQSDELAYYGVRITNDFPTVALANLTSVNVQAPNAEYTISGSWPATQFIGILEPTDRPITSIVETAFNQETLSTWSRTSNVRTINSQQYDLLTQRNNGPTGTFEFRVTHG